MGAASKPILSCTSAAADFRLAALLQCKTAHLAYTNTPVYTGVVHAAYSSSCNFSSYPLQVYVRLRKMRSHFLLSISPTPIATCTSPALPSQLVFSKPHPTFAGSVLPLLYWLGCKHHRVRHRTVVVMAVRICNLVAAMSALSTDWDASVQSTPVLVVKVGSAPCMPNLLRFCAAGLFLVLVVCNTCRPP